MYENFNTVEKLAFKESGADTEYDKVSLQSQVYTPQWVVKFLVNNTLGKMYLEMYPDSNFIYDENGKVKYLIANAPTSQMRHPKRLEEIKLIDPACGSGNFLIYAFSLFYDLYLNQIDQYEADYSRRDIPKLIVENNLYGVDLDERAVQLTQIALFIKAMQLKGRRGAMPAYTHVVSTHFELPEYDKVEAAFMWGSDWNEAQQKTIRSIWEDLRAAYKFGSLIRVEEQLDALLPVDSSDMFANQWKANMFDFKHQMITTLRNQVHQWTGEGSNEYSLAKANDAITFLDILSTKFDVAVANPPYTDSGDFGAKLKEFVGANYSKPLKFNTNLYACFIKRCCELAGDDGKVGMIHPHTFMFIKTFEDVRKYLIGQTHINVMVDYGLDRVNLFGPGILLDATFYTLDKSLSNKDAGVYFNITTNLQEKFKKDVLSQAYTDFCNGRQNDRVYQLTQSKLKDIKSYPFIYWISDEFREKFHHETIAERYDICNGISSGGNNEQFYRYHWEVCRDDIMCSSNLNNYKWVFINKGGPYQKWYGNIWLVFLWENNGKKLKELKKKCSSIRYGYENYYFKEGLAFTGASSKSLSVRFQPQFCIFERAGKSIFAKEENDDYLSLLAFMNSSLCAYLMDSLNPTVSFQSGDIERIPYIEQKDKYVKIITQQNIDIVKDLSKYSIIEPLYQSTPIKCCNNIYNSILDFYIWEASMLTIVLLNEALINKSVFKSFTLKEVDIRLVYDEEGMPVGNYSISSQAKEAYKEWLSTNTEFPASPEVWEHIESLEINEDQPNIDDFESI